MKAVLAAAALLIACTGAHTAAPRATGGPRCASLADCDAHERECGVVMRPACETCAGLASTCVARTADEILDLDRRKQTCTARAHAEFSYTAGCRCVGTDCPDPRAWCEAGGGTFSDDLGCFDGELRHH
jgi:hypothetical protein